MKNDDYGLKIRLQEKTQILLKEVVVSESTDTKAFTLEKSPESEYWNQEEVDRITGALLEIYSLVPEKTGLAKVINKRNLAAFFSPKLDSHIS